MRFDIARDDERRQLIVTVSGPVTTEDVSKLIAAVRGESVSTYGLLYDAREIDVNGEMTAYYIRDLAASARLRAPLGGARGSHIFLNAWAHAYLSRRGPRPRRCCPARAPRRLKAVTRGRPRAYLEQNVATTTAHARSCSRKRS